MKTRKQWLAARHTTFVALDEQLQKGEQQVVVFKTDEDRQGKFKWVITLADDEETRLDSFKTKDEALLFCEYMGWTVDED